MTTMGILFSIGIALLASMRCGVFIKTKPVRRAQI